MHVMFKRLVKNCLHINNNYSKTLFLSSKVDRTIIRKQSKELKLGRQVAQQKFAEMLNIKPMKALEIVTSHKSFSHTSWTLISENYELCSSYNLSKDIVLKYPYILIEKDFLKKIKLLSLLSIKLSVTIPLVKLSLQSLQNACSRNCETTTRINDLCRIFNITSSQSCEILATKPFLLTVELNHIESQLKFLMESGICKEDILKDMWIFKYSESFIRNRLEFIKEHKVENVKPWMIRCPEETLYKHIKRESDNRDILGENSVAEYLSERLKCSENMAKYLIRKQPALQTKSLLKLNEMIDFLYKHGFTSTQICRIPKVLLHSTITATNRIKELEALGYKPDNLYLLTKSQKQYMQHIETLTKAKTKVKTI